MPKSEADKLFEKLFRGEEDSAYDPDEFYTRATNKHDHSKNIQTPFPDTIFAEIHNIVRRGTFPKLTSPQAFIRDACVHRLHHLVALEGNYESAEILNTARVLSRQEDWKQRRREMREMVANLDENIGEAFSDRDWDEAEKLCDEAELDMSEMAAVFRRNMEQIIDKAREKIQDERKYEERWQR